MSADHLEALIESLLWEGYALYPYTPSATKNATPTPFGIAYPPAYAERLTSTYDHLEVRVVLNAPADAVLTAEVRLLAPVGERHQARAQRCNVPGAMVGALAHRPAVKKTSVREAGERPLAVLLTLSANQLAPSEYEVILRVENRTLVSSGLDRKRALERSLLSVHPVLRVAGGRFVSALERPCGSVNTFPVLAVPDDTVVLGAAIVLPDHPQIAPESRGALFDSTEIEEALRLHLQVLSDGERAELEQQDPAVREMLARAAATTPEDMLALHGRVTLRDPTDSEALFRDPVTTEPPSEPPGLVDPTAGEDTAEVDGVRFARGDKLVIHPPPEADIQARMLDGRTATLERLMIDYDGRLHLGVTIDDDPGQDLMRETGRYLYFFAQEVEVLET
jgi:hypothetical protein